MKKRARRPPRRPARPGERARRRGRTGRRDHDRAFEPSAAFPSRKVDQFERCLVAPAGCAKPREPSWLRKGDSPQPPDSLAAQDGGLARGQREQPVALAGCVVGQADDRLRAERYARTLGPSASLARSSNRRQAGSGISRTASTGCDSSGPVRNRRRGSASGQGDPAGASSGRVRSTGAGRQRVVQKRDDIVFAGKLVFGIAACRRVVPGPPVWPRRDAASPHSRPVPPQSRRKPFSPCSPIH